MHVCIVWQLILNHGKCGDYLVETHIVIIRGFLRSWRWSSGTGTSGPWKKKQYLRNCVRRQPYTLKPRRKRREREDGESKMWSPFYLLSCKICRSIATQNIHQRRSADTKEGAGGAWFAIPGIPFFTSIYKTYILQ